MNTFDLIILVILLLALWRGFTKGFIKSVISLVGWLVALVIASRYADSVAPLFSVFFESPVLQLTFGFLTIILAALTIQALISSLANRLLNALNLKIVDRIAGGVLGTAKGVVVVLIALSASAPIIQPMPAWSDSQLGAALMPLAPVAMAVSKQAFALSVNEIKSNNPLAKKSPDNESDEAALDSPIDDTDTQGLATQSY